MLAGAAREFSFNDLVPDAFAGPGAAQESFEAGDLDEVSDAAAEDLLGRKADSFGLQVVDAEVAKLDGVEEGEADRCGLVNAFEFGALTLCLLLTGLEMACRAMRKACPTSSTSPPISVTPSSGT